MNSPHPPIVPQMRHIVRPWLVLACTLILCLCAKAADEYTEVPIKVNVLKGVTITDTEIENIVKEANKILKQAKVQLGFTPKKDIIKNAKDTGNDDGKIQESEEAKLDKEGAKELKNAFGAGKGIKIYFTNKIRNSDDTRGLAPHSKEKNGKLVADPVIYLKNLPTVSKEVKGNDLAHESAHVMTLGTNHWIDKTKNKRADGTAHHATDSKNLMYAYNPFTVDGKPVNRGTNLTDDQKKEIQAGAKRLGKTKVAKTPAQTRLTIAPISLATLPTLHGGFIDDLGDAPVRHLDLGSARLFAETPSSDLEISLLLGGLFPQDLWDAFYAFSWYFNTDNDETTGDIIGNAVGIDKILYTDLFDLNPGAPFFGSLFDVHTYESTPCSGRIERIVKLSDVLDGPIPDPTDELDGLHLTIPLDALGPCPGPVPVHVVSEDLSSWDQPPVIADEANFELYCFDPNDVN